MRQRNMQDFIRSYIKTTRDTIDAALADETLLASAGQAAILCIAALKAGHKILFAGNGGSAADAQHMAAELVSRFNYDRPGLPAIALTTDSSALTAIGNDYGFERVFARQLEALGNKGDVLVAISTSGNSPNILAVLNAARAKHIATVGLTGQSGGKMLSLCDVALCIPSADTPHIQEGHTMFGHLICQIIEDTMFGHLAPSPFQGEGRGEGKTQAKAPHPTLSPEGRGD
jgi:D-sedoheptulose 7-phosphate isomerase